MSYFDQTFPDKLRSAVETVESSSSVEMVVVVKKRSAGYYQVPMGAAMISLMLSFLYFMLAPTLFGDLFIATGMAVTAIIAYGLFSTGSLQRLVLSSKILQTAVELKARAIFQKVGIHHTKDETGILIYASIMEKRVMVVADRGVESVLPAELKLLENELTTAMVSGPDQFVAKITESSRLFGKHLPIQADDINELPDYIDIDF